VEAVHEILEMQPGLVAAEFTAGRGIGKAIHLWTSVEMAKLLLEFNVNVDALHSIAESPVSI
jgi:hypothetical protein